MGKNKYDLNMEKYWDMDTRTRENLPILCQELQARQLTPEEIKKQYGPRKIKALLAAAKENGERIEGAALKVCGIKGP